MRVLIVNTNERTGGAAVAAGRLVEALTNNGVKAKMLVRSKETDNINVVGLPRKHGWLIERLAIFARLHFSRRHLFEIDIANCGNDITRLREFKEADVIHLHWINQGFLSIGNLRKILDSGKPVVWTMHDAWPATAICHYTRGCGLFKSRCHNCQLLPDGGSEHDLASRVWKKKQRLLQGRLIHFVACSNWLAGEAKRSALLTGQSITSIPNPIDTRIYHPKDKAACRMAAGLPADKRIVLFVSQRVTDKRKGMEYLVEAVKTMTGEHPEMLADTAIAILGGHAEELEGQLTLPVFPLGYVSDERKIVDIYNAADLFVSPSLEDNLPNTIMESLACGVPCVGFKVGGIPEMIDNGKNGYVAALRDAADLAHGMHWALCEADTKALSEAAVRKVATCYSQHSVASKYIEVYNQAMAYRRYKL